MSPSAKSHVFGNLAKYVRTGMGIEKACESMLSQPGVKEAERKIYDAINHGVRNGKTIAVSMDNSSQLEALDFQMLDASERGGRLDMGLNHLSGYYQRLDRTQKRIRKGLIYPIFLFHFALIITTFIGAWYSRLDFNNPTPKPMGEAIWDTGKWVFIFYLLVVGTVAGLFALRKMARTSPGADRLLNLIPVLGKAKRFAALERFTSVFEIFLLAGMTMDQAMRGAGEASNSGLIRTASEKGAKAAKQGELIAASFFDNRQAFPNDFARGVASAEEAGVLDVEFGRWRQFYGESLSDAMDQLADWVPKIVYFTCLFVVAAMIIRLGLSYINLLNGIMDGM